MFGGRHHQNSCLQRGRSIVSVASAGNVERDSKMKYRGCASMGCASISRKCHYCISYPIKAQYPQKNRKKIKLLMHEKRGTRDLKNGRQPRCDVGPNNQAKCITLSPLHRCKLRGRQTCCRTGPPFAEPARNCRRGANQTAMGEWLSLSFRFVCIHTCSDIPVVVTPINVRRGWA